MAGSRTALYPLLYPLSLVMRTIVGMRHAFYATGILQQHYLPRPVISVGNLSLGGEGKTPLVIHIASLLHGLGAVPALLSRGYGRVHPKRSRILAPGNEIPSPWKVLGDEPAVIRRAQPQIWTGISERRYEAASEILQRNPQVVFILDDGFQHRRLHRDLDLVVIDCSRPLQSNRIFPLGTLREPLGALRRAHGIVLNAAPASRTGDDTERLVRKVNPKVPVFHCRQQIADVIPVQDWQNQAREGSPSRQHVSSAFLVTAIGNPGRFRRDAKAFGIEVKGARFYRDHQQISVRQWVECGNAAQKCQAEALLTTEKDAIKLSHEPRFPTFVARQSTTMLEQQEFTHLLQNTIGAFVERP